VRTTLHCICGNNPLFLWNFILAQRNQPRLTKEGDLIIPGAQITRTFAVELYPKHRRFWALRITHPYGCIDNPSELHSCPKFPQLAHINFPSAVAPHANGVNLAPKLPEIVEAPSAGEALPGRRLVAVGRNRRLGTRRRVFKISRSLP
jgi:hypothetical protein